MSAPPGPPEPEPQITFHGDQDDWDKAPPEWKEHVEKAFLHKAGLGAHPGKYKGPQHQIRFDQDRNVHQYPTESDLARQRFEEEGPPTAAPARGPLPPQESVQQPAPAGGGKKQAPSKPPSGTTPTGLGAAAVKPEEPQGNF